MGLKRISHHLSNLEAYYPTLLLYKDVLHLICQTKDNKDIEELTLRLNFNFERCLKECLLRVQAVARALYF